MANVKIRGLPSFSDDFTNGSSDFLIIAESGSSTSNNARTSKISISKLKQYAEIEDSDANTKFTVHPTNNTASIQCDNITPLTVGKEGLEINPLNATVSKKYSLAIYTSDAVLLPAGNTAQRPTPVKDGLMRFNSELSQFEGFYNSAWQGLGGVIDVDQDTYITAEESTDADSLCFYTSGIKAAEIDSIGDLLCHNDIVAFYSSSDERLKENVKQIEDPIDKINKIRGVSFDWKEELKPKYSGEDYGVIAQEIESVLPAAVKNKENGFKSVKYNSIIPLLIECIKNQENRIKELEKICQSKA